MTDERDRGGFLDTISDTVDELKGEDSDAASGSDAVPDVPTDVAGTARRSAGGADAESGDDAGGSPQFGPGEGGISDVLPGGPGIGTDEDDTPADA